MVLEDEGCSLQFSVGRWPSGIFRGYFSRLPGNSSDNCSARRSNIIINKKLNCDTMLDRLIAKKLKTRVQRRCPPTNQGSEAQQGTSNSVHKSCCL